MTDLYETVGVEHDADDTAIRAGWKKAVRKAHPDAGGDRKTFDQVQTALLVLSDPKRRARYDRTGQFDNDPTPDNERSDFMLALTTVLEAVVEFSNNTPEKLRHTDLCRDVIEVCGVLTKQSRDELARLAAERERWEAVAGRFQMRQADAPNPLRAIIHRRLAKLDQAEEKAEANIRFATEIATLINQDVRYEVELTGFQAVCRAPSV